MTEDECDRRIESAFKALRTKMQIELSFWSTRGHVNQAAALASVCAAIDDTITELRNKLTTQTQ